eukprot:2167791-Amphidinium_carterae.1
MELGLATFLGLASTGAPSGKGWRSMKRTERKTLKEAHHVSKEIGPGTSTARYVPSSCSNHARSLKARWTRLPNGVKIAKS